MSRKAEHRLIVVGSAIAAYRQPSASLDVRIRVGPIQKVLRVFGDRAWYRHSSRRMRLTDPLPFERANKKRKTVLEAPRARMPE